MIPTKCIRYNNHQICPLLSAVSLCNVCVDIRSHDGFSLDKDRKSIFSASYYHFHMTGANPQPVFIARSGNKSMRHMSLHGRHNGHESVSNHQPHDCLLSRLFRRRSKKTSTLRVTALCVGYLPGPVNSPHKWPLTRKMFPFDDVIMFTAFSQEVKSNTNHSI